MNQEKFTFAEMAIAVNRFEMESIARRGTKQSESVIRLAAAEALGLFGAESIMACKPESPSRSRSELLDELGQRDGSHWLLRSPQSDRDRQNWDRLLRSDQVLVFVAPLDAGWVTCLVSQLFSPFVATVPSMSLSASWEKLERSFMEKAAETLHVSSGGNRTTFTFLGNGDLFRTAVLEAAEKPPLMWEYSSATFKETARSRKMFFRSKIAVAVPDVANGDGGS